MPKKSEAKKKEKKSERPNENSQNKKEVKKLSSSEYENKIMETAKKGFTAEKIGEQLKQQGIHSKEYKKKISKILKEKNCM